MNQTELEIGDNCNDDENENENDNMISLEAEKINESFLQRYSERLKERCTEFEEDERKIRSLDHLNENASRKSRVNQLSPFASYKAKSCENKINIDDFTIILNEVDDRKVDHDHLNDSTFNTTNNGSKIVDLTDHILLPSSIRNSTLISGSERRSNKNSRHSESNRFNLPRRTDSEKIFEEFLVIGIESQGLEYIFDRKDLLLNPKIIYSYPNKLGENELKL
jgi:hypothetical protein